MANKTWWVRLLVVIASAGIVILSITNETNRAINHVRDVAAAEEAASTTVFQQSVATERVLVAAQVAQLRLLGYIGGLTVATLVSILFYARRREDDPWLRKEVRGSSQDPSFDGPKPDLPDGLVAGEIDTSCDSVESLVASWKAGELSKREFSERMAALDASWVLTCERCNAVYRDHDVGDVCPACGDAIGQVPVPPWRIK